MSYESFFDPLVWGGFLGMFAVALGAFGAHGLEDKVSPDKLEIFHTGTRYHLLHSLLLVALGLASVTIPTRITISLVLGIFIFSGSLYGIVLTGISRLGMITPVGGLLLIVGWAQIGLWAILK